MHACLSYSKGVCVCVHAYSGSEDWEHVWEAVPRVYRGDRDRGVSAAAPDSGLCFPVRLKRCGDPAVIIRAYISIHAVVP